jgi:hypothetical protein
MSIPPFGREFSSHRYDHQPGYLSAWLCLRRARFRFARQDYCIFTRLSISTSGYAVARPEPRIASADSSISRRRLGLISQMGGKSCKFQGLTSAAIPDYLIGGFDGGRTAADSGCE